MQRLFYDRTLDRNYTLGEMNFSFLAATPFPLEERIGTLKVLQQGTWGPTVDTMKPCDEERYRETAQYWYDRGITTNESSHPLLCANDAEMFISGEELFYFKNFQSIEVNFVSCLDEKPVDQCASKDEIAQKLRQMNVIYFVLTFNFLDVKNITHPI